MGTIWWPLACGFWTSEIASLFLKQTFCLTYMGPLNTNHSKRLEWGPLVGPQGPQKFKGKSYLKFVHRKIYILVALNSSDQNK